MHPDEAIAELLASLNRGQYILLVEAIRQLGGELRIDPLRFSVALQENVPGLNVDATDGPVVLRLVER